MIPATGSRFSCNMVSAIDNSGHLAFKMFEGKFTGTVFIDFMRRLVRQVGHKVFLIVDNLRVHRAFEFYVFPRLMQRRIIELALFCEKSLFRCFSLSEPREKANLKRSKSEKVTNWVAKHAKSIRLFFLPKYSPDLNPHEYLNQDVKSNAVGRRRARNKSELKTNVSSYLRSIQKQPAIVKSFFQERHVKYAIWK